MVTRRVRQRQFLLRPDPDVNQNIRYVLAVMAKKYEIKLHAVMFMSNHYHICLTDPEGRIVDFERDFNSFVAHAINAQFGEREALWNSSQSSHVVMETPLELVREIAYTMANPVEAGLVRTIQEWPGVAHSWPCEEIEVERPKRYFSSRKDSKWPEKATLRFSRPDGFDEYNDKDLADKLVRTTDQRELDLQNKHKAAKRGYLGTRRILKQSRHSSPSTKEEWFKISPRIACLDKDRRQARIAYNQNWRKDYAAAWEQWKAGDHNVVFPYGTYQMRVLHSARVAEEPTGPAPTA